jgi:hypothetical protein
VSQPDDGSAVSSPQPGAGYRAVARPHRNRLRIGSLILGVGAWPLGQVYGYGLYGYGPLAGPLLFGLLAFLFGLGVLTRVIRGEANSRGRAIAGIALGVVLIVVGLALLGRFAAGVYENAQHRGLSHHTGHLPFVAPGAISVATDFDFRHHVERSDGAVPQRRQLHHGLGFVGS